MSFINFFVKERRTVVGLCLLMMIFGKYVISFIVHYFRFLCNLTFVMFNLFSQFIFFLQVGCFHICSCSQFNSILTQRFYKFCTFRSSILYILSRSFTLARSYIKVWYDQLRVHNSNSSRIFFNRSSLGPFRDMIFSKTFVLPWLSGVPKHPLPCFVDATPQRVAGISGKGCFSRSLPSRTPIFEAELCAALSGIYYHLSHSNYISLVGDNLGVLFVLKKGSCRNSSGNFYLQNLAKVYLQSRFLLDLRYIRPESNPADCLTRRSFSFFLPIWHT